MNLGQLFIGISIIALFSTFLDLGKHKHKVVFQFTNANDTLQQKAFTNQLNNLVAHWPNAEIEVVTYNHGIEYIMTSKSKHINDLLALNTKGVKFAVCQNTMNRLKITKDQLLPFATVVPAGIAEIVEKQEKGWSYIKGGF